MKHQEVKSAPRRRFYQVPAKNTQTTLVMDPEQLVIPGETPPELSIILLPPGSIDHKRGAGTTTAWRTRYQRPGTYMQYHRLVGGRINYEAPFTSSTDLGTRYNILER